MEGIHYTVSTGHTGPIPFDKLDTVSRERVAGVQCASNAIFTILRGSGYAPSTNAGISNRAGVAIVAKPSLCKSAPKA